MKSILLISILLSVFVGFSQPANDNCVNAIALTNSTTNTSGTTTSSVSESLPTNSLYSQYGVWYTFTGTAGAPTTITTLGNNFDLAMTIYTGSCGALSFVANVNNSNSATGIENYSFTATANTYYVYVAAPSGAATGDFSINLNIQRPVNDECVNATTLSCSNPGVVGTTAGTLLETPPTGSNYTGYGVWYKVSATASSAINAVGPVGSSFQLGMTIYTGTCGSLTTVTTPNVLSSSTTGIASKAITSAGTYYIYIANGNTTGAPLATGEFSIAYIPSTPCNDVCYTATNLPCGDELAGSSNGAVNEKGTLGAILGSTYFQYTSISSSSNQIPLPNLTGITTNPKMYISVTGGTGVFPLGTYVSSTTSTTTPVTANLNSGPTTALSNATIIISTFPNTGVWYKFKGNGQTTTLNVTPITSGFVPYVYVFSSPTIESNCNNLGVFSTSSTNIVVAVDPTISITSAPITTPTFNTVCDQTYYVYIGSSSNTVTKGDFKIKRTSLNSTVMAAPSVGPFCQTATVPSLNVNNAVASTSCGKPSGTWNPSTVSTTTPGTYTYVYTPNEGQCVNTTPIASSIIINPSPTPLVLTGSSICAPGTTGTITSTTSEIGVDYQLYDASNTAIGSVVAGTGSSLTWTNVSLGTGYYTASISSSATCNGISNAVDIIQNPAPTISGTLSACVGATTQLSGSGTPNSTNPWLSSNTTVATISSTGLVNAILAGTTTITYTDNLGCSKTAIVTVNAKPTISGTLNACVGSTTQLTGSGIANGSTPWSSSNTTIASVSSTGLVTGIASGTVTITYMNSNGCTQSATVIINAKPSLTSLSGSVCSGNSVSLSLTSSLTSSYSWIATDNANTTGESTTFVTGPIITDVLVNNTSPATATTVTYSVTPTATASGCVGTSQTVTITVNPKPTMTSGSSTSICSGGTLSFALTSNLTSTYTWVASDNPNTTGESTTANSGSAINNTLNNTSTTSQDVVYTVTPAASSTGCSGTSQTVTITVNPKPTMTNATSGSMCTGNAVNFGLTTDVASTITWKATSNGNVTGETYSVTQTGSTITDILSISSTTPQNVTYTVTPTSSSGNCVGTSQTIIIAVNPKPTMTSATTTNVCSGTALSFALNANLTSSYSWVASDNSNTTGESTTAVTGATITDVLVNNTSPVASTTVTYTVTPTATASGCQGAPQTVTITVKPSPTLTSQASGSICSGATLSFPLTSNISSTFSWVATDNPNTTGESTTAGSGSTINNMLTNSSTNAQDVVYTVTPTSSPGGCLGTSQIVTITVNPKPTMTNPNSGSVCSGNMVNFGLTSSVLSSITWKATSNGNVNGESTTNQLGSTITDILTISSTTPQTVTYTVTPTSSSGNCVGTAQTVTIAINPKPTMTSTATANVCSGTALSFALTANIPSSYSWVATDNPSTTGESTTAVTSATITDVLLNNTSPATSTAVTYTITPTATTSGCQGNDQLVTITVNPILTPSFSSYGPYCLNEVVNQTLSGTSNNGINGSWFPTSISTAIVGDGTYTFTPNTGECANNTTITITVNQPVDPTFNQVTAICQGDVLNPLPTSSIDAIPVAGTWTPAINNNATTTYTFTPNAGECANNATMTITVNQPINPTFNQVSAICQGDVLNPLPTNSIDATSVAGTWAPTINNNASTTYTFTPNSGECANNATMTITVNEPISPTFNQVSAICQGDVLNPLPTSSIDATPIVGTWTPTINNNATTTYTFTPNAGECANNATMTITVNQAVNPTFNQVTAICQGDVLNPLPTSSNNATPINGTWSPSINNNTTTTYTFTPNTGECANDATMTITVNQPINPTFNQVAAICQGEPLNALPTTSIDATPITGTWSPTLDNTATTTYTFTPATGACASATTMDITVNPSASVANLSGSTTLNVNQTTSFTGNSVVLGGGTGTWSIDDVSIATVNSSTGLVTAVAPGTCVITYSIAGGCGTASASETITVNSNLDPITATTSQPTCTVSTGSVTVTSPLPALGILYILTGTNPSVATQTNTSGIFNLLEPGDYDIAYIQNGDTSAVISLTIDPQPYIPTTVLDINVTQPNCTVTTGSVSVVSPSAATGTLFILTKTSLPTSTQTNATGIFSTINVGSYALTYTENNSCPSVADTFTIYSFSGTPTVTIHDTAICAGQSVSLTAVVTPPGGTFLWSNAQTNATINVSPSTTTNYQVFYSVTGCPTIQGSGTVTIKPIPTVLVNNLTICEGASAVLASSCSPSGGSYLWSPGNETTASINVSPNTTTTYTLNYTVNGCSNSSSGIVTVNSLVNAGVTISSSDSDNSICAGDLISFTATPTNGGTTPTYQWYVNGSIVSGETNTTYNPFNISNQDVITVEMTSNELCVSGSPAASPPIEITVNLYPNPIISSDVQSGCSPLTVNFSNSGTGSGNCTWTIDGGNSFSGCDAQHTFTDAGCYNVSLSTTVNGCTSQSTLVDYICVTESPVADFTPTPEVFTNDVESVTFNNYSTNATSYLWDFGDESFSTIETPTHEFSNTVDGYTVTLTATASSGCQDQYSFKINRKQELVYYIPNTFTPNGDEFNQTFKPIFTSGFDPFYYTFSIYNRFGNLIFESHDPAMGWDGSYNDGKTNFNCQVGTYVWTVEYNLYDLGAKNKVEGSVNLVR